MGPRAERPGRSGLLAGMRPRLLLPIAVVLGCAATHLSAKGRGIGVLEADPGADCAVVGTVVGVADPFFGGLKPPEELAESARNEALNEAGRRGATHVRFVGAPDHWPSGTFGGTNGVSVHGVAYDCGKRPAAPIPPAPSGDGCTKDTDCKGDRICESRTCVEPDRVRSP